MLENDINKNKSTILIVDPNSGHILYTNQDINKMNIQDFFMNNTDIIKTPIIINNQEFQMMTIQNHYDKNKQRLMLTDVFYYSPNPIVILDINEHVMMLNQSFTDLFGYTSEELIGKQLDQYIIPQHMISDIKNHFSIVFSGDIVNKETIRKTKDHRYIDVHILGIPLIIDHEILGVQVIYTDITEKLKDKQQLILFKEIIQNNSDGVMITDELKRIQFVNPAFTSITGYKLDEIYHKMPDVLKIKDNEFLNQVGNKQKQWQGEVWSKNKNGKDNLLWLHVFTIKTDNGEIKNYVYTFKNLTEMDSMNKKMLLMMQKDPLTSLYNRVYFMDKVNLVDQSFVLFFDVNRFKDINDTYGHNIGDEILIEFSKSLLTVFKDHLVARYGGDEFIVYVQEIKKDHLSELLNRFINKIKKPIVINQNDSIELSTSIGITQYSNDGLSVQDLIKQADQAMYVAKHNNMKFCFYQDIHKNVE